MTCPRCGTKMEGGVCPECGFPVTRYWRKKGAYRRQACPHASTVRT